MKTCAVFSAFVLFLSLGVPLCVHANSHGGEEGAWWVLTTLATQDVEKGTIRISEEAMRKIAESMREIILDDSCVREAFERGRELQLHILGYEHTLSDGREFYRFEIITYDCR